MFLPLHVFALKKLPHACNHPSDARVSEKISPRHVHEILDDARLLQKIGPRHVHKIFDDARVSQKISPKRVPSNPRAARVLLLKSP
jgi:hypothetical protein